MSLLPPHERSRHRGARRGLFLLVLALGVGLLAPVARALGLAGGPLFAFERAASAAAAPLVGYFSSKAALADENVALRETVERLHVAALERDALAAERDALRAELGVGPHAANQIVAEILLRPPQTAFDSLVLGAGAAAGIAEGGAVLARGVPVGVIVAVSAESAVASLFSAPGSRLAVTLGGQAAEAVGRGDGRYTVELPVSLSPATGTPVLSVAHHAAPIGFVSTVSAGEGEATVEAQVALPVDLATARYVTVEAAGKK